MEQTIAHIEQHLGTVSGVFHEILSDRVHVDVHVVPATADRPYMRLVTWGMSDLPMTLPDAVEAPQHMELMITLPGSGPLQQEAFDDERHYGPIRLLKVSVRLTHRHATWLGSDHTVSNGHPARPYANGVGFDGTIVMPSTCVPDPDGFSRLFINKGKTVVFMSVVPLYPEEMMLALHRGTEALQERFRHKSVNDICTPRQPNAAQKRLGAVTS